MGIQSAARHLKWSRKECLAKNSYGLLRAISGTYYNLFDRDVNTVKLLNIQGSEYAADYEYVWVLSSECAADCEYVWVLNVWGFMM